MPLEVPKNPKIYTSVYSNFAGVDYTNDASNVWRRRSPNGLNMLPDIDGRPYKRTGWKIELSKSDYLSLFLDALTAYDSTATYAKGDYCKYDGNPYICNTTINPAEAWDSTHWDEIPFEQYKLSYFDIGGTNYIACFTSYGLFFYSSSLVYVSEYIEAPQFYRSMTGTYKVGDYCMRGGSVANATYYRCTTEIKNEPEAWTDPPTKWTELSGAEECVRPMPSPSYEKSFFFEGGGDAGFYFFTDNHILMKFDGHYIWQVRPKEPIVLIGCEPGGAGELYEEVNLLNEWRCVGYTCDGTTLSYTVPDGFDITEVPNSSPKRYYANGIYRVLVRDVDGTWYASTHWSVSNNTQVVFDNGYAPQVRVDGEDNLRVYYKPEGASVTEVPTETSAYTLQVTRTKEKVEEQINEMYTDNGRVKWHWVTKSTKNTTTYNTKNKATIAVESPKYPLETYVEAQVLKKDGTTWTNTSYLTFADKGNINAYSNNISVSAKSGIFNAYQGYKTTSSTKTTYRYPVDLPSISGGNASNIENHLGPEHTYRKKITTTTDTRYYKVRLKYTKLKVSHKTSGEENRNAFYNSSRAMVFGNGLINQVFLTASSEENYNTRAWYSAATNPAYFPDTNYIEAGATDKPIMGLMRVGEYLGIIKQGSPTESAVYLAYPTSFENETTYAIKQSVNGVGAISNGAFNILEDEPMFLSAEGVMAIEPNATEDRQLRNRSVFVNKKLCNEESISGAVSFVYEGMYWLAVDSNVYVLDGSQKTSWANTKTNLQYEAYYLENVPSKCFAKKDDFLWFIDGRGNLCRFKKADEYAEFPYVDEYTETENYSLSAPSDNEVSVSDIVRNDIDVKEAEWTNALKSDIYTNGMDIAENGWETDNVLSVHLSVFVDGGDAVESDLTFTKGTKKITIDSGQQFIDDVPSVSDSAYYTLTITYYEQADATISTPFYYNGVCYCVTGIADTTATVRPGAAIVARWGTIADDDNAIHYFKNFRKKGCVISLLPSVSTDTPEDSGVRVYLKADEKDRILVGEIDAKDYTLPFDFFPKKKLKKYKRLQIICENDSYNDSFGVDSITKCYTIGNYSKNRKV